MSTPRRIPWRVVVLAMLVLAALTVAETWPVARELSTRVAGLPGKDGLQYTWLLWWADAAQEAGLSPAQVPLNHPWRIDHPLLALTGQLEWAARWLEDVASPVVVYNLLWLGSFVLCGLAMLLLAWDVTERAGPAILAAVLFAFAPHRMGHALAGHLTQMALWWAPLMVCALLRLFAAEGWRAARKHGLLAGLWLGWGLLVAPVVSAYVTAPLATLCTLGLLWRERRRLRRCHALALAVTVAVGLALAAPSYAPFLRASLATRTSFVAAGAETNVIDLLAPVLPSPYHPLWGAAVQRWPAATRIIGDLSELERVGTAGWIALILAAVALVRRQRGVWLWLAVGGVAFLLALGPELCLAGRATGIPLPYALVQRVPILSWGRTPERYYVIASLCLALLAAQGLATLSARPRRDAAWWQAALIAGAACELLIVWPWPLGTAAPPAELTAWRAEGGAALTLPITKRQVSNTAMLWQTAHGRPIVGGYIHRELPGMRDYNRRLESLCLGQAQGASRAPTATELRAILQGLGIRHVLVDAAWTGADWQATATRTIGGALGGATDAIGAMRAYAVPPSAIGDTPALAAWNEISLLTVEGLPAAMAPGGAITVTTLWRADALPAREGMLAVHLVTPDGARWAQTDGPPVGGNWPTTAWAPGTTVRDERRLVLANDAPPGDYDLALGWYSLGGGGRWPRTPAQGGDEMWILTGAVRVP